MEKTKEKTNQETPDEIWKTRASKITIESHLPKICEGTTVLKELCEILISSTKEYGPVEGLAKFWDKKLDEVGTLGQAGQDAITELGESLKAELTMP